MAWNLPVGFVDALDEVYKRSAVTDVLSANAIMVREGANVGEIQYPVMDMDGMGDYDRNSGYADGSASLVWKTAQCNYERGRKFNVDAMDNQEAFGLALSGLGAEFVRLKVAPEGDAFTFATLAGTAGIGSASANLADGAAFLAALIAAKNSMDEAEVTAEGRILFATPTLLNAVMALDTTKSREALASFAHTVAVPQTRFYTAIDLLSGRDGEAVGNYRKSSTSGKDINFMIVEPSAVMKYDKHVANHLIAPENNPDSDGYILKYRKYGMVHVFDQKKKGVFCHYKTT